VLDCIPYQSRAGKRDGKLSTLITYYLRLALGRASINPFSKEASMLDEWFGHRLPKLPSLPKRAVYITFKPNLVVIEHGLGRASTALHGDAAVQAIALYDAGQWHPLLPGKSRQGTPIQRR